MFQALQASECDAQPPVAESGPPSRSPVETDLEPESSSEDDNVIAQSPPRRKTSAIHFFFTEASSPSDKRKMASKNPTSTTTAYGATTGNSTLRNHLRKQHPRKYEKLLEIESADDPKSQLSQLFQTTIYQILNPANNLTTVYRIAPDG
ncbi:hypothetical protein FRC00_012744 [Tulasnella sp. 408]|nr:hypothetical protein FRC00_012744 [Tulasnella sp. 408]